LDLVLDLNYFYFSNPNPNPTYLSKHQTLRPNHKFSQRISYLDVLLCACVHGVKSDFSQVRNFAWHRINEREAHQGEVVTAKPPKRLAQLRTSSMSDPLPAEAGCKTC